jgi:hypothetical protein
MTSRVMKSAFAISLGILTNFFLPYSVTQAADECLSAPQGATPQGSHWYYHLERGTGRKCWYLGSQGAKINNAPQARASQPANKQPEAPAAAEQSIEPSVANARAEFNPTPAPAAVQPAAPIGQSNLLSNQSSISGSAAAGSAPGQTLSARWPDPDTFKPTGLPQTVAQNTPDQSAHDAPIAAPQTPATVAEPHQSATAPVEETSLTAGRIILSALFIVIAIAAILARVAFRYFAGRKPKVQRSRRDIWAQADDDERPFPPYVQMVAPERHIRTPQPPKAEADEIEYLLRRAAQREARERHFSS